MTKGTDVRNVFGMFSECCRNSHLFYASTLRHLLGNFIIVIDTRPRIELVADPRITIAEVEEVAGGG